MAGALRTSRNGIVHVSTVEPASAANNACRIHAALRPGERRKVRCARVMRNRR